MFDPLPVAKCVVLQRIGLGHVGHRCLGLLGAACCCMQVMLLCSAPMAGELRCLRSACHDVDRPIIASDGIHNIAFAFWLWDMRSESPQVLGFGLPAGSACQEGRHRSTTPPCTQVLRPGNRRTRPRPAIDDSDIKPLASSDWTRWPQEPSLWGIQPGAQPERRALPGGQRGLGEASSLLSSEPPPFPKRRLRPVRPMSRRSRRHGMTQGGQPTLQPTGNHDRTAGGQEK